MTKAISQSGYSDISYLGSYVADLLGFDKVITKVTKRKSKTDLLLDKYRKILRFRALSSYEWQEFVDYLRVDKVEGNRIVVSIDAPTHIEDRINLLEYGTPGNVANPLMRVAEAEFNDDFELKRMQVI
jgi:hypothetical protein